MPQLDRSKKYSAAGKGRCEPRATVSLPDRNQLAALTLHGFDLTSLVGPIRCQVRFGSWVGGKGVSPGSMVTWLGFGTEPPRGPRSMYSPGRDGFSPGFWSRNITSLPIKKFRCRNQALTQSRGRRIRSLGLEHQAGPGRRLPRFGTKPSR